VKRGGIALAIIAGIGIIILMFAPRDPDSGRDLRGAPVTTYSPGPYGSKALFLLLKAIGLETRRLRRPDYNHLPPNAVLWVLSNEEFGHAERRSLVQFIRSGGTLIAPPEALIVVLEEAGLGKADTKEKSGTVTTKWGMRLDLRNPAVTIAGTKSSPESYAQAAGGSPVVASWAIGGGHAVSLGVNEMVRNDRIGRAGNGIFLARLALSLGSKHVFDEFKTGFGDRSLDTLLANVPYRWGLAQLALAGGVGLLAFARRRLPAEPPPSLRRRRTLDHVEAVARMWERANDAGLPLQMILSSVAERARGRLGGGGGDTPFVEWIGRVRPELRARAQERWEQAVRLCDERRPSADAARWAALYIKELEREVLKW
jgi:Domain of unknown function (DUF4350)